MRQLTFFSLVLCLLTSCNSNLEDIDAVPESEKIQLAAKDIASGGKDMTTVIARIPKESGAIPVTFTVTAGSFIYSTTKTDKQPADSVSGEYRFATTILKSDTSHGSVYITVNATTVQKRITIKFK